MHALAGVPDAYVSVAIVVHGPAAMDLVNEAKRGGPNPNAPLIAELVAAGASIQLCGQTAAARGITQDDLLPGVTLSLSAMTAHALLQQDGYTLNPF
jgi:intracellular sulfur oxidation DsrE/DsrF family protein